MPDVLEQGLAWLDDQRHAHMTRTVTYERGADSVQLQATVGRTESEQLDDQGILQRFQSRDYLLRTADLVLAGEPTLPKAGDVIKEPDGAQMLVYEVMALSGEPPWRYSDPYRRALRLHTKYARTE